MVIDSINKTGLINRIMWEWNKITSIENRPSHIIIVVKIKTKLNIKQNINKILKPTTQ